MRNTQRRRIQMTQSMVSGLLLFVVVVPVVVFLGYVRAKIRVTRKMNW